MIFMDSLISSPSKYNTNNMSETNNLSPLKGEVEEN